MGAFCLLVLFSGLQRLQLETLFFCIELNLFCWCLWLPVGLQTCYTQSMKARQILSHSCTLSTWFTYIWGYCYWGRLFIHSFIHSSFSYFLRIFLELLCPGRQFISDELELELAFKREGPTSLHFSSIEKRG